MNAAHVALPRCSDSSMTSRMLLLKGSARRVSYSKRDVGRGGETKSNRNEGKKGDMDGWMTSVRPAAYSPAIVLSVASE